MYDLIERCEAWGIDPGIFLRDGRKTMTVNEAIAQITFLSGRIVDICMGMGIGDTDDLLRELIELTDEIETKLRNKDGTNEPND
jgi:hypothetical protein